MERCGGILPRNGLGTSIEWTCGWRRIQAFPTDFCMVQAFLTDLPPGSTSFQGTGASHSAHTCQSLVIKMSVLKSVLFPQTFCPFNTMCTTCRTSERVLNVFCGLSAISSSTAGQIVTGNLLLHPSFLSWKFCRQNWSLLSLLSFSFPLCPQIILGHQLIPGVPREKQPLYFPFKTWIFNFMCLMFNMSLFWSH